ncbi:Glutamine--tRNA ligase [uncultured Clostridium sp.]|nr:Glutamine--tRNA ligase [uncultured Clostridium sp.]
MNMRDPAIYRIKYAEHHRQGSKWCIYPMYDFAHPIQDAIEGITHSMCSLEFENHRPLYNWVIENIFGTAFPKQRRPPHAHPVRPAPPRLHPHLHLHLRAGGRYF